MQITKLETQYIYAKNCLPYKPLYKLLPTRCDKKLIRIIIPFASHCILLGKLSPPDY